MREREQKRECKVKGGEGKGQGKALIDEVVAKDEDELN